MPKILLIHSLASLGAHRKVLRAIGAILVCSFAVAKVSYADIYMFTDEHGTQNFSNVPSDRRYALALKTDQELNDIKSHGRKNKIVDISSNQTLIADIKLVAATHHLDPALLRAVIATESGNDANTVSNKGAMGLMQLMPETAQRYGASDPFDPGQNIRVGAEYLSNLLQRFGNNLPLALAAYNSGESNVVRYGGRIPPFPETVAYVPKVIRLYRQYQLEGR